MIGERLLRNPVVRQAIQGGLAIGLAIGFGTLLSGRRWYWAALSAFIVAIGVGSRGEALVKALQRVGGTVVGIVAGIGLAMAVSGHTVVIWVLVMGCVFGAFYAFQQAYEVMTVFITLLIALLYSLLGQFSPELLVVRLEETAVGGAAAALTAFLVLPMQDDTQVRQAACQFLEGLAGVLEALGKPEAERMAAVRGLQLQVQALRAALGPLKRGWPMLSPPRHRLAVRSAMHCAYLARELALSAAPSERVAAALREEVAAARDRIEQGRPEDGGGAGPELEGNEGAVALRDAVRRFERRLEAV